MNLFFCGTIVSRANNYYTKSQVRKYIPSVPQMKPQLFVVKVEVKFTW